MQADQIKDRQRALCAYIEEFEKQVQAKEGISLNINAKEGAKNICLLYERYAEDIVRPVIDSAIIQNFKIIANTELCVIRVAPISIPTDEELERAYNAKLALFIAIAFLIDWHGFDPEKIEKLLDSDAQIQGFLHEHVIWLKNLDPKYQFPVFSNSHVWRLFTYLISDRIKQS